MPSKTPKQARFMAAVAHGWKPDRVAAPPMKVATEFNEADSGKPVVRKRPSRIPNAIKKFNKGE